MTSSFKGNKLYSLSSTEQRARLGGRLGGGCFLFLQQAHRKLLTTHRYFLSAIEWEVHGYAFCFFLVSVRWELWARKDASSKENSENGHLRKSPSARLETTN